MIEYNDVKDMLGKFVKLPKPQMAGVFVAALVISVMSVIIYFQGREGRSDNQQGFTEVKAQITDLQHQVTTMHDVSQNNWQRQFRHNDSIDARTVRLEKAVDGLTHDVSDLTVITAANSPAEVFKYLSPYLSGIKEDTYRTILWIHKQEVQKAVDGAGIVVRKKSTGEIIKSKE